MRTGSTAFKIGSAAMAAAWLTCLSPSLHAAESDVEASIGKLETERVGAMLRADIATLDRLFADDLTYTHASGVADTKASLLSALSSGRMKYEAFDRSDVRVRVYAGAAVITGKAAVRAQTGDKKLAVDILFTAVWVKGTEGGWRMVAWQSTRPPE